MLDRLNAALDHLEHQLATGEPVDVAALARVATVDGHHFRRMFSTLAGMPLSTYVRRRRMTLAAADVLDPTRTLLEVAVAHGYGSVEAFSRAFATVHGVPAGQARRTRPTLVSQPRVSFQLVVRGDVMQYRIVEKPSFHLVGRRTRVPLVHLGRNEAIETFERGLAPSERERIAALSDQEPHGPLSVTDGLGTDREEGSTLDYWHAVATSRPAPGDLDSLEVPAGAWVVLSATGPFPEALQHLWRDAYGSWFPANPWQVRPGPELLRATVDGRTATGELWLPVAPR